MSNFLQGTSMLLDQINLNYLRIFESVYRTRSMTQAAQELHLTQSGISQHIKSLEESLDVKLFDRIKQKLIPTEEGKSLYESISPQLKNMEQALLNLTAKDHLLRGEVTIGMPVVFGLNVVIPYITEFTAQHPDLKVNIRFELAHTLNNLLLSGEVDFAFVDDFTMDTQIKTQKVYDEALLLCCADSYYKKRKKEISSSSSRKTFESFDYIAYERGEPILRRWFQHHVKGGGWSLSVQACVADALGIAKFITSGLGVGALPGHHVELLEKQGHKFYIFDSKAKETKNKISVAYVANRSRSTSVQASLDFLMEKLQKH